MQFGLPPTYALFRIWTPTHAHTYTRRLEMDLALLGIIGYESQLPTAAVIPRYTCKDRLETNRFPSPLEKH